MNYLAHTALAAPTQEARTGAILGDFMRGVDPAKVPAAIWHGVLHHRAVDRATDSHPATRELILRLPGKWRRFGGILLDVYFDHLLIRHWDRLRPGVDLRQLTSAVYDSLETHDQVLPDRLRSAWPRMREEDWLASYGDLDNVRHALVGIGRRFRRNVPLAEALPGLIRLDAEIEAGFMRVFEGLLHLDDLHPVDGRLRYDRGAL